MSITILTTGGQIPGTPRRERRCAKNALFVKARATAWVINKTRAAAEKVERSAGPLKRTDCKRVSFGAHGWKSRGLGCTGDVFSLSGREAATLLVCFGLPAVCIAGDMGTGCRPNTMMSPRPKLSKRVSPQGECRRKRLALAAPRKLLRRREQEEERELREYLAASVRVSRRKAEAERREKEEAVEKEWRDLRTKVAQAAKAQGPVVVKSFGRGEDGGSSAAPW